MLVRLVRKARRGAEPQGVRVAHAVEREDVERVGPLVGPGPAVASRSRSRGPPSCSRTRIRVPLNRCRAGTRPRRRGPGALAQDEDPAPGVQDGGEGRERPGDQGHRLGLLQGPAEPGAGVRDGGRVRVDPEPAGADGLREGAADAVKEGSPLARTATARPAWAASRPGTDGRRGRARRPARRGSRRRAAGRAGGGTDQDPGGAQDAAGGLGEPVPAVRADPDDRHRVRYRTRYRTRRTAHTRTVHAAELYGSLPFPSSWAWSRPGRAPGAEHAEYPGG